MMKKTDSTLTAKNTAALACVLILTACGGGSGGGKRPDTGSKSVTPPKVSKPNTPSKADKPAATEKFGGVSAVNVTERRTTTQFGAGSDLVGSGINKLVINGEELELIPADLTNVKITEWFSNQTLLRSLDVFAGLQYVRFGQVTSRSLDEKETVFAYGELTDPAKMPTADAQVHYQGKALYLNPQDMQDWKKGESAFTVNFGKKTIEGKISSAANEFTALDLKNGKISGNGFSGTTNGVVMKGRFFGPNAQELGGTFYKGDKAKPESIGSFGAKKQ